MAQPVEGGVARVVTDLVRAQTRAGLRVVVACPEGGGLPGGAAAAGAEVARWTAVRELGPGVVAETLRARRLIRRVAPDLVHAHSAKAGLAARLAVRGTVPTVYQPHAWSFEAVEGTTAHLARAWERRAARWTARVLCVSEGERRTGEEAGIAARWTVVPNGVPERENEARAAARSALPLLGGMPADAPLVVCVGRLCPQKGQGVLLDAWRRIAAEVPDARLVLVGDGPDRSVLARLAPPGVEFAGASDEVDRWYAAADLVVLPSRWEGMALTPLEAMACGRPVVLTDVGGARECLPPGQQEACLVPPDDPEALAEAIGRLLGDPQHREFLGEAARKHVRAEFDLRRTAASVLRLYGDVLGMQGPDGTGSGRSAVSGQVPASGGRAAR
ncbi:glycosyltransferase family 4 protein [Streptomyces nanshensis]|uniref:glycosyltransferase family 4 protein n=1 Tax=Streptomyces nanshensis TaxID=518642 RepID=UPI0030B8458C